MADFPDSIYNLREIENQPGVTYDAEKKSTIFAEDIEGIAGEVTAIETTLGTNPEGDFTNVKERLDSNSNDLDYLIDSPNLVAFATLGSQIKEICFRGDIPNNTMNLVDNQAFYVAVQSSRTQTFTGVAFCQTTQGVYTADQNCKVALYFYGGGYLTKVAECANDGTLWKNASNTFVKKAFTTPFVAQRGLYYIGILYNSSAQTTAPAIARQGQFQSSVFAGYDFTSNNKICGTVAGQNDLPTTQLLGSILGSTTLPWLALY